MEEAWFIVQKDLEPYINCIMVGEDSDPLARMHMPLYADGYPGIMFQQSAGGFYLLPKKKKLSELFLYGQTLEPVSLETQGPYRFVVVQLYPFASKYLLGVDPRELNDDCYDLLGLTHVNMEAFYQQMAQSEDLEIQAGIIQDLMQELITLSQIPPEDRIHQAINLIIRHQGQISISEVRDTIFLTERTFERKFLAQVGLTPKQFARIIQFQTSLHQLNSENYDRLIEVGLDSGFADQSHFIRTFKKYTGQSPSYYLRQMSSS